jgi:hypothetical protein
LVISDDIHYKPVLTIQEVINELKSLEYIYRRDYIHYFANGYNDRTNKNPLIIRRVWDFLCRYTIQDEYANPVIKSGLYKKRLMRKARPLLKSLEYHYKNWFFIKDI